MHWYSKWCKVGFKYKSTKQSIDWIKWLFFPRLPVLYWTDMTCSNLKAYHGRPGYLLRIKACRRLSRSCCLHVFFYCWLFFFIPKADIFALDGKSEGGTFSARLDAAAALALPFTVATIFEGAGVPENNRACRWFLRLVRAMEEDACLFARDY